MIAAAYPASMPMPTYTWHTSPSIDITFTGATTTTESVTTTRQPSADIMSYAYPLQPHLPVFHHGYTQHPSENGYHYTSAAPTKRWIVPMGTSVTSVVAGQIAPGRIMTDHCVGMLNFYFSNLIRPVERSELRRFVKAVLEASAVSVDVVLLALYYIRQTTLVSGSTTKEVSIPPQSIVVDAHDNTRLDGGDKDTVLTVCEPGVKLRLLFVAALTCAHKFDADAAYTTRTWADLGGLETPELVRAERELLARLHFQLNVTHDELNAFRLELNRWGPEATHGNTLPYYNKASQLPRLSFGNGPSSLHCACASCVVYPGY